ncbi:multisubunit sodium/proton antiporter, MrpD subunit [Tangfeifania diversioriginum]|uniref:Multisubunit sodium/proton antiporter, MrpD subunit n=1 Tax=Tangfeifania diversioriginum TaxID=1168035 RepID=A0A1M6INY8_9BACT|nr:proton-conducting transporter membrane subunit [Tangfeifania diversioriginum]SHJ36123.1 multisubunit sodium/proton antiporter, MrpD subunit [Tangfeifania diversioriginum]
MIAFVALPILIPFVLIITLLIIRSDKLARWVGPLGAGLLILLSVYLLVLVREHGVIALQMGGWEAPFGITLVVDYLSALMLVVSAIIIFSIAVYALRFLPETIKLNRFFIFFFGLTMGLNGAFVTGDVFNLFVWFEVMLMSSFVLITLGRTKNQLEGGIKYMALNLVGSMFFLAGVGLLYGKTGTLNMAHLAEILKNDDQAILMNTSAVLFFVAFGIKAAVFPLYFWLPASYHTPNITISSLFAGLLTKVGVYTFIRFFTLFFVHDPQFWHQLLLVIAGLTMVAGGMAAAAHYETRRILSYHIISQIGYMIMGLGIFTPLAIAGAVFFTIHNMVAKTNTFLVSGMINKARGTYELKDVGGLFNQSPLMAVLFVIPAFALAGAPPISGFFAKFILIKAGIENGNYGITAVAVLTGMLTLYSMIKIWNEAFLKKQPENEYAKTPFKKLQFAEYFPSVLLGAVSILMGIFAFYVFDFTMEAGAQLTNPELYIETVLKRVNP